MKIHTCEFRDNPQKGDLVRVVYHENTQFERVILGLCLNPAPESQIFAYGEMLSDIGDLMWFRKPDKIEVYETCVIEVISETR